MYCIKLVISTYIILKSIVEEHSFIFGQALVSFQFRATSNEYMTGRG